MNFKTKMKSWNSNILQAEKLPAVDNALKKAVEHNYDLFEYLFTTDTRLFQYYLGCASHEIYILDVEIEKGTDIIFASLIDEVIKENYKCNNNLVKEHLESWIGTEGFQRYDYDRYLKNIGFNHSSLSSGDGEFIHYISAGNCFLEDSNGTRFGIHIPKFQMTFGIMGCGFKMSILADGNTPDVRVLCSEFISSLYVHLNNIIKKKSYALNPKCISVPIESISWDKLKIPAELKRDIDFHITSFISHINEFKKAGIRASRGIIIVGPPGNGKTMLTKILCTNIEVAFFYAKPNDFSNNYGEPGIEDLYRTASKNTPAIVLIEDADIYLQSRTFNSNGGKLSEFLNIIDGINDNNGIITILTCNNPELLDEAVRNRPKRFDVIIEFPNPALEQRKEILFDKLKKHLSTGDISLIDEAAEKFEGFSGAHICEFAERLIMSRIYSGKKCIDRDIFDEEIEKFGFSPSGKKGKAGIS